jgi:protein SCO1/2
MLKLNQSCHLKLKVAIIAWLFLAIFFPNETNAHVEHPKVQAQIGIDQKLGNSIPLDLKFRDENGHLVTLGQLIHKPTILAFVYYHCPNVCSFLLQNLADTLNRLPAEPGKEYEVLSVSFDEKEKPALALEKKKMYLKMIGKPFPKDAWRFLTGDQEDIHKLAEAIGFNFKRVGEDFEHPVSLVILSNGGKIIRYMYGTDILPFELKLALIEASQGRIGPAVTKVLRFCFSYDPTGNKLVFNALRVTGTVTILFALSFILFIIFKGKKRPTHKEYKQ